MSWNSLKGIPLEEATKEVREYFKYFLSTCTVPFTLYTRGRKMWLSPQNRRKCFQKRTVICDIKVGLGNAF